MEEAGVGSNAGLDGYVEQLLPPVVFKTRAVQFALTTLFQALNFVRTRFYDILTSVPINHKIRS